MLTADAIRFGEFPDGGDCWCDPDWSCFAGGIGDDSVELFEQQIVGWLPIPQIEAWIRAHDDAWAEKQKAASPAKD